MQEKHVEYGQYEELLRELYGDLKKTMEIGREIRRLPEVIAYQDWDGTYYPLGMILTEYQFEGPWTEVNFQRRYLETYLADVVLSNEWEMDTYEKLSVEDREKSLNYAFQIWQRQGYLQLKPWSSSEFCQEFSYFAEANGYTKDEISDYSAAFEQAFIFELGGCYPGDHDLFVLTDVGRVFSISFGYWD